MLLPTLLSLMIPPAAYRTAVSHWLMLPAAAYLQSGRSTDDVNNSLPAAASLMLPALSLTACLPAAAYLEHCLADAGGWRPWRGPGWLRAAAVRGAAGRGGNLASGCWAMVVVAGYGQCYY